MSKTRVLEPRMSNERTPITPPSLAPLDENGSPGDEAIKTIESSRLFSGRRELVILHNRDRYILRITRQGKLILNK